MRSRWLLAYAAFFMLVTEVLLRFSGDPAKAQLSLVSVVLFLVPLVSIVFGTVYLYNAREFIELLLAQPVNRRQMYGGLYLGLTLPLVARVRLRARHAISFFTAATARRCGTLACARWHRGVVLTCVFTAIASLDRHAVRGPTAGTRRRDRRVDAPDRRLRWLVLFVLAVLLELSARARRRSA